MMEVFNHSVFSNQVDSDYRCDFCQFVFGTSSERNEHILNHFEQEICSRCDQNLLRIGGHLYVLHATVTCIGPKIKTEAGLTDQIDGINAVDIFCANFDNGNRKSESENIAFVDPNQSINHTELELKHEFDTEYDIEDSYPNYPSIEDTIEATAIKFSNFDGERDEMNNSSDNDKSLKQQQHHLMKNSSGFQCVICMNTYKRKHNLEEHIIRVHNPQSKQFKCMKCKKTFASKYELYRHGRNKKRVCERCNESFCSNAFLQFHRGKLCSKSGTRRNSKVQSNVISDEICEVTGSHDSPISTSENDKQQERDVSFEDLFKFKCDKCNMSFSTKGQLKQHSKIIPVICERCSETFCSKSLLRFHQEELCQIQNRNENSNLNINMNMEINTNKNIESSEKDQEVEKKEKKYTCEACGKMYGKRDVLNIHIMRIHTPSKVKHSCKKCGQLFISAHDLKKHITPKFICNACGEIFCGKSSLVEHREHKACELGKMNRHQCEIEGCGEIVAPHNWVQHVKTNHNYLNKRFECDICNRKYSSKFMISNHILALHCPNSKQFKCDQCDYACISDAILKTHKNKTHLSENRFICSDCGKTFKQKNQMQLHMHIHTGAKPYGCLFGGCDKRFRSTVQRVEHMRMHTGEKPYECSVDGCDRRFAYRIDLKRHEFSAHGIFTKKYPCQICSEIFPESMFLKRHMKKHEKRM